MNYNYELINIILGIVIGYLLYKIYISPTIIKGPNSRDIINKIYNVDNKLYKLRPTICMYV